MFPPLYKCCNGQHTTNSNVSGGSPEALKTPPSSLTCHTIYAVLEGGQEIVVLVARIVVSLLECAVLISIR